MEDETKPGEAMQIVEAIMRQVNNLVKSVKAAADEVKNCDFLIHFESF